MNPQSYQWKVEEKKVKKSIIERVKNHEFNRENGLKEQE